MPAQESQKSWKDQNITIPVGALLMVAGVVGGGAGQQALTTHYGKEIAEIRLQLHDVQKELHTTNEKLAELSDLIDRAYPRTLPNSR